MLFAQLPDDLFRPLASPSRAFNAALLLHLHRRVIGSEPMRKADLLAEIGAFAGSYDTPELADDDTFPPDAVERRSALYRRFLESGWLIERRERYVPVVEFDPEARLLLEELSRLERGETRSYGGAVLEVLGSLESALANPAERSEALANAAREANAFLAHLRGLAGAMRKIEDRILREEDRRAAFRLYFEDFVERHLISDYRTLHTRFNPFRFRSAIVREAGRGLRDVLMIRALAEGLVREGRAGTVEAGERAVRADLAEILSVFEGIDRHLDAVDEVVARMERRIAAAVRYMDRPDSLGIERTAAALRAVGAAAAAPDVPADVSLLRPPLGEAHLATPRRLRPPIDIDPLPEIVVDSRIEAFVEAKAAFRRRTTVTPERMAAFVEARLPERGALRGSDLTITDVDAFIVFQRLREMDVLFEGALGARFSVTHLSERLSNGWLDCPDFVLERRADA
ncbi:Wadjet anti-phage system protein JetA family protein [Methylobacterium symbioticum]|uniref:Uncharacterized protein n=1 Tax=Methylobacterium symbioticum TaxID=2584084 RepID=A0A509EIP8_9HYPH|nr:Wadjet anti-phage system protein JetA family protein [Methylobacterium symbioticum]VUD74247.1 hypothetical protein MET9862_04875 [Methylobacterium symbioticum]